MVDCHNSTITTVYHTVSIYVTCMQVLLQCSSYSVIYLVNMEKLIIKNHKSRNFIKQIRDGFSGFRIKVSVISVSVKVYNNSLCQCFSNPWRALSNPTLVILYYWYKWACQIFYWYIFRQSQPHSYLPFLYHVNWLEMWIDDPFWQAIWTPQHLPNMQCHLIPNLWVWFARHWYCRVSIVYVLLQIKLS